MSDTLILGRFAAVLLKPGDHYGRDFCLTVKPEQKALVEFWDLKHPHGSITEGASEQGQFTGGRYYAETLRGGSPVGLMLDTSVPEWTVPADDMALVLEWLADLT